MDPLLEKVVSRALGSGPDRASGVRLQQRGTIRLKPGGRWCPFQAEQVIQAGSVYFRWEARVSIAPLVKVQVVDAYEAGSGLLDVRLWKRFRLATAAGPEIDAGERLRYMSELPWCPYAYRDNRDLTIRAVDESHLSVSGGNEELRLTVDAAGDVVEVFAAARPRLVGEEYVSSPWGATFSRHERLAGLRVPTKASVSWHLEDGPFEYFRGEIVDLQLQR
jgi:hypothetical protein